MKENDKNIIDKITHGDLTAFEDLFRSYYEMLCLYALKIVKDPDEAEEIVQDLFYTIWEKRNKMHVDTSVKSYLFTAVHNKCLKYLRHQHVESDYAKYQMGKDSGLDTTPEEMTEINEMQKIVNHTLDALPERCSSIFRLSRFDGLKYQEIADRLSISVKTVEANMGKALRSLRENLKDYTEIA